MEKLKVNGFMKWSNINEDIPVGYAPKEITFMGYTTKNLHHSADATKAFMQTIEKVKRGEINDATGVLHALKATDTYMGLNDMHLEQGKAPDEAELATWRKAHVEARNHLHKVGEFMHHMDYWHNHEHELQGMEADYTPATAGAEMADSYQPQGDLVEELTDKTIKQSDKVKVARMIADMLGVEKAESMSPEVAINTGLRHVKTKRMTPELVGVLRKMLGLASDVGIKVDMSLVPKAVTEQKDEEDVVVDPASDYNAAKGILRLKDYMRLSKVGHALHPDEPGPEDEQLRRRKVKYKTEEVELDEAKMKMTYREWLKQTGKEHSPENSELYKKTQTEDLATADYKVNPETGRKHRAGRINFANSGMKDKLEPEAIKEEDDKEDNMVDMSDGDLDKMADKISHEDHILDLYEPDELQIVDAETGEEVEDEEDEVNEEVLNEVLSRIERMRAKIRFMRTKAKRTRRLMIALKRRSDTKTINKRARRLAVNMLKQRIMKKPVASLTVAEKERVERMLEKRKAVIDRLAMRLAPRIRRIESDRLTHGQPEDK